ncbi:MAG: YegS/Rv2252/BmrU family lipid kinase [Alloprevotella sp.]|nr:YegS/Rv2252/BmrU family lipid kinase [Alloprevotella sp.]
MAKQKIFFIINPISGRRRKTSLSKQIHQNIDKEKFEIKISYTEYPGHATQLAAEAIEAGVNFVVAVGGDGTVNEVARAVVGTSSALGIIPCGSGNGLARHLQIPLNVKNALKVINEMDVRSLDYGIIDGHPFFCTCGVGFDAFISEKFANYGKRGLKSYVENVLGQGFSYKSEYYELSIDGDVNTHKAFLITCANASQYGNNAFIAPHASMEDGVMDIVMISPFNVVEAPLIATQLFSKQLPKNNHIKMFKGTKVTITRAHAGAIHCDGDPYEAGERIDVELIPHQFKVIVNGKAKPTNIILGSLKNDFLKWREWQQREWRRQHFLLKKLRYYFAKKFVRK